MNSIKALVFLLVVSALLNLALARTAQAQENWEARGEGVETLQLDEQIAYRFVRGYLDGSRKDFKNGIIEFELNATHERAFFYVYFRKQSDAESEVVYIRTHKPNAPDTLQYSPVYQGKSAWQIYHGERGTAPASLPRDTWVKVKLAVLGDRLSVWVGENTEPNIKDMALTGIDKPGSISFRGFIPRGSLANHTAMVRNIKIQRLESMERTSSTELGLEEDAITHFSVSPAFEVNSKSSPQIPDNILNKDWQTVAADHHGVIELLKHRTIPEGTRQWAVAADVVLNVQAATQCQVDFGFSDAITLLLNDKPVFFADASYRYSDNRQQGVMHAQQMTVFLDLKAGENKLRTIIADSFGGWGLQARTVNCKGVTH